MSVTKTIGGNRLGTGNRMKVKMHGYGRSNHNLSTSFKSTMAPGVLYPCYCKPALNGDTFDIDINAFVRTIPTQAPLFGSFKLQVDFFQVPIRLYQAILHNNTLDLGMNASKVIFPKINIETKVKVNSNFGPNLNKQISESALIKYLGISGLGRPSSGNINQAKTIQRKFLAIPTLAYYDIFKNYYANKQEPNAYAITGTGTQYDTTVRKFQMYVLPGNYPVEIEGDGPNNTKIYTYDKSQYSNLTPSYLEIIGTNLNIDNIECTWSFNDPDAPSQTIQGNLKELEQLRYFDLAISTNRANGEEIIQLRFTNAFTDKFNDWKNVYLNFQIPTKNEKEDDIELQPFPLENIDEMRKKLLTKWDLGTEYVLSKVDTMMPYSLITDVLADGTTRNKYTMNGLCVKTYQSDLFNNWIAYNTIAGQNGIKKLTAVSTTSGSFTIDTLNLAQKLYDYFNRVALSGGTYEDWQEVTWGEEVTKRAEKPIYIGGMSSEVMFEEVVSTAASGEQPLGSIGGRGALNGRKGGKIIAKVKEPSFIIGIVSLTPRVCYTQGNEWYNTELDNLEDLHKPALDQIGFQPVMIEQMAWWDTILYEDNTMVRNTAGYVPAYINYMTDVDRAYGDFANEKAGFMVLDRHYEKSVDGGVKDITTYIDPQKYNYAFAYTKLASQNFWTFISFDIKARRKMSAKQIPNL